MSKLLKLRQWLSLADAARTLGALVGETVTEADLLHFAIDQQLTLSIHFVNGAYLRQWHPIDMESVRWIVKEPASDCDRRTRTPADGPIRITGEHPPMQLLGPVILTQPDVFDLPMFGASTAWVEREYQLKIGGPERIAAPLGGITLRSAAGDWYEIQMRDESSEREIEEFEPTPFRRPEDFCDARTLPEDAVFVIRPKALTDFQAKLTEQQIVNKEPSQLSTRERDTLLKMLIGMAIEGYRYDPATPRNEAPGEIASDLAKHGIGVTDDTVRKWLKEAAKTVLPEIPPKI